MIPRIHILACEPWKPTTRKNPMTTINVNVNESVRATVLECAGCGKLLATGAHVPRYEIAWCGCGGHEDYPDLSPWFEIPATDLAGFRLFRRVRKPGGRGFLNFLKGLASRLPLRDTALGLAGGALLGLAFAGVFVSAFAVGATLAPRPASHTAAASPIVCR
jgi:hypothetical protein